MKKILNASVGATVRTYNDTLRAGQEAGHGLRDAYRNSFVRGLGITAAAQVASSWFVNALYKGDPERKDALAADAVFVAPIAMLTGRGLRKVLELTRVPDKHARPIILWANPAAAFATTKLGAAVIDNPEQIDMSNIESAVNSAREYAVTGAENAGEAWQELPTDFVDEAAIVLPNAIAGSVGAVNGMEKPPRKK